MPDASAPGVTPDAAAADARPPTGAFCDPGDPALVGCFRFEDSVSDDSGAALNASASGVSFDQGMQGRALVTTDQSSLRIAQTPALDVGALTIEMWVRPDQLPAGGRAGLLDNDGQYGLFVESGGTVRCADIGASVIVGGALAVNTWTHVACTHDGQTITVYIDGRSQGNATGFPLNRDNDTGTSIAGNSPSGDPFIGRIDELRIWNRARTPDEVCAAAGCTAP